jgi:Flp pilus assembly pilin Flp
MIGWDWFACRQWGGRLARSRSGVTAIEYGLIAASIALAFLAIMVLLGGDMSNMFASVSEAVTNAAGS